MTSGRPTVHVRVVLAVDGEAVLWAVLPGDQVGGGGGEQAGGLVTELERREERDVGGGGGCEYSFN